MATLRRLFAWENRIGDGAVESLSTMKQLRIVNLVRNPLGDDAKRRLVTALPNCLWQW